MHDIVVVGGSAGALDGIVLLLRGLPESLKASVYVVMHSGESGLAFVPDILQRQTRLTVRVAQPEDAVRHGVVYVPPPDHHLLLERDRIVVNRGPKLNRFRPAIDALFTSAAGAYGSRVVGVLLSGLLDDGVHGLQRIRLAGGRTVVQDPVDAPVPMLPMNAMRAVEVDHVVAAASLGELVTRLTREPSRKGRTKRSGSRTSSRRETEMLEVNTGIPKRPPTPFTCPECDGSLWESHEFPPLYFCHVGHRFTASSLLAGQRDVSDSHMWRVIRSLEEQAELHRRSRGSPAATPTQTSNFERHAEALDERALILRRILTERGPASPPDTPRRGGRGRAASRPMHPRRRAPQRPSREKR